MKSYLSVLCLKLVAIFLSASVISGCVASEHDGPAPGKTVSQSKQVKVHIRESKTRIVTHKALPKKRRHKYFVEFRSRPNGVTSHSYIAYGRLYRRGRIGSVKLVGLHPKNGTAGFLIGSVVGMKAQLKPVAGDWTIPHTISFRVPLDYKQYRAMTAFIKNEKSKTHVWNLVLNNCNGFIGQIAGIVGLSFPRVTAVPPSSYVQTLIDMNT